jgi:hypothetical protein
MTNPLIEKYEELYKPKKEEPKSVSKPYTRHDSTIATLEALLEDLKSGRAIMTDCKTELNCNHLSINHFDYFSSPSSSNFMPLPVDRGERITLEIFRKYV